jgi:sulfite exporter TauE/SafE
VVGLYWMGFGAAILLALGLGALMTMSGLASISDDVAYYAVRLGGVLSMAFIGWGLFRYSQAIVIRRKP